MTTDPSDIRQIKGQSKIVEGAGLEESRLNQDFIEWLRKWGSPVLIVIALGFLAYTGWQWLEKQQAKKLNDAYVQLAAAEESKSPDSLARVAREQGSEGAVAVLASLRAADIYYESALSRLAPGGTPGKAEDALNDEQRNANLEQARALYQQASEKAASRPAWALHEVAAEFGLAAVAETLRKTEDAQKHYERAAAAAKKASFAGLAGVAEKHKADAAQLASLPPLRTGDELAPSRKPQPEPAPSTQPPVGPLMPEGPALPPPVEPTLAPPAPAEPSAQPAPAAPPKH